MLPPAAIQDYQLEEHIANLYSKQDWVLGGMDKWMDYIILHSDLFSMPVRQVGLIMKEWEGMCRNLESAYLQLQPALPPPLRGNGDR